MTRIKPPGPLSDTLATLATLDSGILFSVATVATLAIAALLSRHI